MKPFFWGLTASQHRLSQLPDSLVQNKTDVGFRKLRDASDVAVFEPILEFQHDHFAFPFRKIFNALLQHTAGLT